MRNRRDRENEPEGEHVQKIEREVEQLLEASSRKRHGQGRG